MAGFTRRLAAFGAAAFASMTFAAPMTAQQNPALASVAAGAVVHVANAAADCVILLHGLARSSSSMNVMERRLHRAGFTVVNVDYPSTDAPIASLAKAYLPPAIAGCRDAPHIHFVTHSMGGILLRQWAAEHAIPKAGRAVLLGAPNGGSEIVDTFGAWDLFAVINGPAGLELATGPNGTPAKLPDALPMDALLIAGSISLNPVYSALIEGDNDGKVSVTSAFAMKAKEKIILPVSHTWMMMNGEVIDATLSFLKTGASNVKPR